MAETADPLIGALLGGRYRITARLAVGGMGAVYSAVQESLRREVALKVIRPGFVDEVFRERFEQEARATSSLHDPHVVTVHDFGIDGLVPFIVFEKLEGQDLSTWLARHGSMPWRRGAGVLRDVAAALAAAHRLGVVHRDLKPNNVFLTATAVDADFAKVIDFGIAKMLDGGAPGVATETGVVPGTAGYISPERMKGLPVDARADLYALGVIAWDLLAGRSPFLAPSAIELTIAHLQEAPPHLRDVIAVPDSLDALVFALLQKEPEDRPADAASVVAALDDIIAERTSAPREAPGAESAVPPISAPPPPTSFPATSFLPTSVIATSLRATEPMDAAPQRRDVRRVGVAGGAAAAALAVATVVGVRWARPPPPPYPLANLQHVAHEAGIERDPALSPDGRMVAFVAPGKDGLTDVFIRDLRDNTLRNVTHTAEETESTPAFSPDGRRLACASGSAGRESIVVIDVATGKTVRLQPGTAPTWTHDGKAIVFATAALPDPRRATSGKSALKRIDVEGAEVETLVDDCVAFSPALSSDDRLLAFTTLDKNGNRDIAAVVLDATHHRDGRFALSAITHDESLDHSPFFDGEDRLVFVSNGSGAFAAVSVSLGSDGRPEAPPTPWLSGAPAMEQVAVSGNLLAYVEGEVLSFVERRTLDVDTLTLSAPTVVLETREALGAIDVSDDGGTVVVESLGQHNDLRIFNKDGSDSRLLTNDAAFDRTPHFAAGGDSPSVVFVSNRAGGYALFALPNGASSNAKAWPSQPCGVRAPAVSPDGLLVAARLIGEGTDDRCEGLVLWNRKNDNIRTLRVNGAHDAVPLTWRDGHNLVVNDGGSVSTVDVDTGAVTHLADGLGGVVRFVDGKLLGFRGRSIVVIDGAGAGDGAEPLRAKNGDGETVEFAVPEGQEASLAWSASTRQLWLTRTHRGADIYTATLQR